MSAPGAGTRPASRAPSVCPAHVAKPSAARRSVRSGGASNAASGQTCGRRSIAANNARISARRRSKPGPSDGSRNPETRFRNGSRLGRVVEEHCVAEIARGAGRPWHEPAPRAARARGPCRGTRDDRAPSRYGSGARGRRARPEAVPGRNRARPTDVPTDGPALWSDSGRLTRAQFEEAFRATSLIVLAAGALLAVAACSGTSATTAPTAAPTAALRPPLRRPRRPPRQRPRRLRRAVAVAP